MKGIIPLACAIFAAMAKCTSAALEFTKASKHSFTWRILLNEEVVCRGTLSRPVGHVKHWTPYCPQLSTDPVQVVGHGVSADFIQAEAKKVLIRLLQRQASRFIKIQQLIPR
jgi:hypothetical protein